MTTKQKVLSSSMAATPLSFGSLGIGYKPPTEAVGNKEWLLDTKSETILLEINLASSKRVLFHVGA